MLLESFKVSRECKHYFRDMRIKRSIVKNIFYLLHYMVSRPEYTSDGCTDGSHTTTERHTTCSTLKTFNNTLHLLTCWITQSRVDVTTL